MLVSHDIEEVLSISSCIVMLHERKIIFQGSRDELDSFTLPFRDLILKREKPSLEEFAPHNGNSNWVRSENSNLQERSYETLV